MDNNNNIYIYVCLCIFFNTYIRKYKCIKRIFLYYKNINISKNKLS